MQAIMVSLTSRYVGKLCKWCLKLRHFGRVFLSRVLFSTWNRKIHRGGRMTYRLEDQIGFKLRLANQKHLEIFASSMPEITPTQFSVLAKLNEVKELSQNHLGRMVAMDAATTKGVVDRLLKKQLIKTRHSEKDRRRILVSLTDEGLEFTQEAIKRAGLISTKTSVNLNQREMKRLQDLLDKL